MDCDGFLVAVRRGASRRDIGCFRCIDEVFVLLLKGSSEFTIETCYAVREVSGLVC